MNFIRVNLSALLRPVRFLLIACVCTLILLTNTLPAYSLPNILAPNNPKVTSDPTEAETNLLDIEKEAQDLVSRGQPAVPGQKETIDKTNPGLNEVQGTADADKMKRPGNSESTSVEEMIGNMLEGNK